jgi:hypothetical protein
MHNRGAVPVERGTGQESGGVVVATNRPATGERRAHAVRMCVTTRATRLDHRPTTDDAHASHAGDAARGSDLSFVGESPPALVLEGVSWLGWPVRMGRCSNRTLRRRLRGAGPLDGTATDSVDRIATRRPVPVDDQPDEDARGVPPEARSEPRFPGLHDAVVEMDPSCHRACPPPNSHG